MKKKRPKTLLTRYWSARDWAAHEYAIKQGHAAQSLAYTRAVLDYFAKHPPKKKS